MTSATQRAVMEVERALARLEALEPHPNAAQEAWRRYTEGVADTPLRAVESVCADIAAGDWRAEEA